MGLPDGWTPAGHFMPYLWYELHFPYKLTESFGPQFACCLKGDDSLQDFVVRISYG